MDTIPLFKVHMPRSVDKPLLETLHSGFIGQGKRVDEFERRLTPWVDNEYVLTLNSGTSALQLALHLAGVRAGDEVITTPMTCAATITPIFYTGARIRWADIDPATGNILSESIQSLVSNRTKAIVCVHFGGYPCDLTEINAIADEHGIKVIEDAAHALGAKYKGRNIGSASHYAAFSLQAIKHITTVDGGILTVRDKQDYERGKLLRWYGIDREGPKRDMRCEIDIAEAGWKYHMSDVSAVIGLEQLKHLGPILSAYWMNAWYYDYEFEVRNITRSKLLSYKLDRSSAYWLYTILVDDRDSFQKFMTKAGVQVSQVHSRVDSHSCFSQFRERVLPGVDEFTRHQVSIPVHWDLSYKERRHIMDKIEEFDRLEE